VGGDAAGSVKRLAALQDLTLAVEQAVVEGPFIQRFQNAKIVVGAEAIVLRPMTARPSAFSAVQQGQPPVRWIPIKKGAPAIGAPRSILFVCT